MSERWLPVPGFEDKYEVSDLGRVRSLDRTVIYVDGRIARFPGKLLCGSTGADRYPLIYLPGGSKYLHDLVATAFIGPKPKGAEVCHNDDNAKNNAATNLYYGDRFSNAVDKIRNGGQKYADENHSTVFSEETIAELRSARGTLSSTAAERRFGISARYVREIWSGEKRTRG